MATSMAAVARAVRAARAMGRRDSEATDVSDEGEAWVPEPALEVFTFVSEDRLRNTFGVEEMVYRAHLDFGRSLGNWDVYVTRSNLSSLISQVQVSKIMRGIADRTTGGRGRRHSEDSRPRGSQADLPADHPQAERPHSQAPSRMQSGNPRPMASQRTLIRQISALDPPTMVRNTDADLSDDSKPNLSKLLRHLFVPAVGNAERIRKVHQERLQTVTKILKNLLSDDSIRNLPPVKEFLRISPLTFDLRLGPSFHEGWVKISAQPRSRDNAAEKIEWKNKVSCGCCVCACAPDPNRCAGICQPGHRKNRRMWAVIKPTFIAFYADGPQEASTRKADFVVHFTNNFIMYKGYSSTASHRSIILFGDYIMVRLKFKHRWVKKIWAQRINAALHSRSEDDSVDARGTWTTMHENNSFAPQRFYSPKTDAEVCRGMFHVDGESYFKAVREALLSATHQIFIMGWWVAANLPLIRPASVEDMTATLMGVLEKKAMEGVQICVIMYNNVQTVLKLDSEFQMKQLKNLKGSENIHVLRHPEHKIATDSIWFWSHHQKVVVVDQRHAFSGGIDLTWGRFDNADHLLYDPNGTEEASVFPGIDFSNVRDKDFTDVHRPNRMQHNFDCPRMPWHDVHCEWRGAIARDVARHFIHHWNHSRFSMRRERAVPCLLHMDQLPLEDLVGADKDDGVEMPGERLHQVDREHPHNSSIDSTLHSVAEESEPKSDSSHSANEDHSSRSVTDAEADKDKDTTVELDKNVTDASDQAGKGNTTPYKGSPAPGVDEEGNTNFDKEGAPAKLSTTDSASTSASAVDMGTSAATGALHGGKEDPRHLAAGASSGSGDDTDHDEEGDGDDDDDEEEEEELPQPPSPPPQSSSVTGESQTNLSEGGSQVDTPRATNTQSAQSQESEADEVKSKGEEQQLKASRREAADKKEAADKTPFQKLVGMVMNNKSKGASPPDDPHSRERERKAWGFPIDAQAVRSLGHWAGACPNEKETSIEKAMRNLIEGARRFVYIENQFFISGLDRDEIIANRVLNSLFKRIMRAAKSNEEFKVYIVIPLLPAFEGKVNESPALRRVMYYQLRSISRGPDSLFANLLKNNVDPDEYICFFGLRTWQSTRGTKTDELLSNSVIGTELVYVHSKVIVVDDEACLVGSGNINDRSLIGTRDTEFAVVVRDPEAIKSDILTEESFAKSFRLNLFREHFGDSEELADAIEEPWKYENYKRIRASAAKNTTLFEKHFNILPRNSITNEDELRRADVQDYCTIPYSEAVERDLENISGHAVIYPLNFLVNYDLKPAIFEDASGAMVGETVFT